MPKIVNEDEKNYWVEDENTGNITPIDKRLPVSPELLASWRPTPTSTGAEGAQGAGGMSGSIFRANDLPGVGGSSGAPPIPNMPSGAEGAPGMPVVPPAPTAQVVAAPQAQVVAAPQAQLVAEPVPQVGSNIIFQRLKDIDDKISKNKELAVEFQSDYARAATNANDLKQQWAQAKANEEKEAQKEAISKKRSLMADYESAVREYRETKLDPNRFWNNTSTFDKIRLKIAQAGGMMGGSLMAAGGADRAGGAIMQQASNTIKNLIDQDIELQMQDINKKGKVVGFQSELYDKVKGMFDDESAQRDVMRKLLFDAQVAPAFKQIENMAKSEEMRSALQQLEIETNRAVTMDMDKAFNSQSERAYQSALIRKANAEAAGGSNPELFINAPELGIQAYARSKEDRKDVMSIIDSVKSFELAEEQYKQTGNRAQAMSSFTLAIKKGAELGVLTDSDVGIAEGLFMRFGMVDENTIKEGIDFYKAKARASASARGINVISGSKAFSESK